MKLRISLGACEPSPAATPHSPPPPEEPSPPLPEEEPGEDEAEDSTWYSVPFFFLRQKPLKDQAQGWHSDLNDSIRRNIRPFLLAGDVGKKGAGLFRTVPLKLKDKDRGTEPHRPKEEYPWFWCEEEPCADPMGGEEFIGAR